MGAVARELLPAMPTRILRSAEDAAQVARQAAELALSSAPEWGRPSGARERDATLEALLYRGLYAVNAVRRLARAWLGPTDGEGTPQQRAARVAEAMNLERGYLRGHVEANRRRVEGARGVDVAAALYGPLLGWYHLNPTLDPRIEHLDAHGHNFRADGRPPAKTGAWPGVLLHCGCVPGPPHRGERATLLLPLAA